MKKVYYICNNKFNSLLFIKVIIKTNMDFNNK